MENSVSISADCSHTIETIWECWTEPEHMKGWYFTSPDWFVPYAAGEFAENGEFCIRMAAKDKSASFDFRGTYTRIKPGQFIEYYTEDGRRVLTLFSANDDGTITIYQEFEPEPKNALDIQKQSWETILNNFVQYVESQG